MKKNIVSNLICVLCIGVLLFACTKADKGYINPNSTYQSWFTFNRGTVSGGNTSSFMWLVGTTPPYTVTWVHAYDSTGKMVDSIFRKKYPTAIWTSLIDPIKDTTDALIQAKQAVIDTTPFLIEPGNGMIHTTPASINIPKGSYTMDIQITNASGSKIFPAALKLVAQDPVFVVSDAYNAQQWGAGLSYGAASGGGYNMLLGFADSIADAGYTVYNAPWGNTTAPLPPLPSDWPANLPNAPGSKKGSWASADVICKGIYDPYMKFTIERVAEFPNRIELLVKDKNSASFNFKSGQVFQRPSGTKFRPNFANIPGMVPNSYGVTDSSCYVRFVGPSYPSTWTNPMDFVNGKNMNGSAGGNIPYLNIRNAAIASVDSVYPVNDGYAQLGGRYYTGTNDPLYLGTFWQLKNTYPGKKGRPDIGLRFPFAIFMPGSYKITLTLLNITKN